MIWRLVSLQKIDKTVSRVARIPDFHRRMNGSKTPAAAATTKLWQYRQMMNPTNAIASPTASASNDGSDNAAAFAQTTGSGMANTIADVVGWLEHAVIGLNLCPFAKAVHRTKKIRYFVSVATDREALTLDLARELTLLQKSDPRTLDTTLLIHPGVLNDFYDYNAFLPIANRVVERLGLAGQLQIASFHPEYEFADCAADAIDNYTNRSPYPMLHLLRETSIERAIASGPEAADIYRRNIDTMRTLGVDGWQALGPWSGPCASKTVPDQA